MPGVAGYGKRRLAIGWWRAVLPGMRLFVPPAHDAFRRTVGLSRRLANLHPSLAAEFVSCVSEPGRQPTDLLPCSNKRCRWRCHCGREWTTSVAARVSGSGCPSCGRMRTSHARATAAAGSSLEVRFPQVAAQFVANVDHPERLPATLKFASHDRCRWRCDICRSEWTAPIKNRTLNGTGCPTCRGIPAVISSSP